MKRMFYLAAAALSVVVFSGHVQGGDGKNEDVVLDGLKSKTPAGWKKQEPSNKLRKFQFLVPRTDGDGQDADLAIFQFPGGGSVKDNIKRWQNQFTPPKGKSIDEVTKVDTFKVGKVEVTYADIRGTYKDPFKPNAKPMADYRRFGVIFPAENAMFFITLTGPEKTMAKHKMDFDGWLKNFK